MVQFEFKIVTDKRYDEEYINSLGREGWKLTPTGVDDALYFERPYYPPGHDIIT